MYCCNICTSFASQSFSAVVRHIGNSHGTDPRLSIMCPVRGCPRKEPYGNYESFRSHVYRKHKSILSGGLSRVDVNATTTATTENEPADNTMSVENGDTDPLIEPEDSEFKLQKCAARFLLKTREERRITQVALDGIVHDVTEMFDTAMKQMQSKLEQRFQSSNPEILEGIRECCANMPPFAGLNTQYRQQQFFRENFDLLDPVERVLGRHYELKNGKTVEVVDRCYDVPLLESLQCLLSCSVVQEQVFNSHSSTMGGQLNDYCDGKRYKQCDLFCEDPCALQIQLYYDEADVCHEIGSKSVVHKLGLIYYVLGNLHPKLRSMLKGIHLLNVTYYKFIVKYGIDAVLEPIVDAVKSLEEDAGVELIISGQKLRFRGTITVVSADNLSAQLMGGYKALNAAFRKCRYCMATDDTMQSKFKEEDFQLRTRETHAAHCAGLGGPLHAHIATTFGVTRNALLNSCRYFHVIDGLVPDIMHDILEGALPLLVKQLLTHYIREQRLFTLASLNSRISTFKYGPAIKNKPSQVSPTCFTSNDTKLHQSASQMWCLARYLPLMIGDVIPQDDDHWENFLVFLDLMDYVFAPTTTPEKIAYVAVLVEDYLTEFSHLYERRLTPKMHYLVHLSTWMTRCGPLSRVWCMRFEAKHSYLKHLARVIHNFINVPKTLAKRHQNYMCCQLLDKEKYLQSQGQYFSETPVPVESLEYSEDLLRVATELNAHTIVSRARSAKIDGSEYHKTNVIICHFEDHMPVFGEIIDIVVTPLEECILVMRPLVADYYSRHFHAYHVIPMQEPILVYRHMDIYGYQVYHTNRIHSSVDSSLYVCVKYHIF